MSSAKSKAAIWHDTCWARRSSTFVPTVSCALVSFAACSSNFYPCLDATCQVARCREIKKDGSPHCPSHTCRERDCHKSCYTKPYCADRELLASQSQAIA